MKFFLKRFKVCNEEEVIFEKMDLLYLYCKGVGSEFMLENLLIVEF